MKQKLGLMCTLLHRPEILLLDEPSNGVDPVSRRDFWAILYQLVKDGITVLVTTAYLDEAERCNRVGLMYNGRLIQCETPEAARHNIPEECYQVEAPDPRAAREVLLQSEGVLCVEPSGATLHLFLVPERTSAEDLRRQLERSGRGPAVFQRILPSLEDVFIALVRKAEKQ
jgi:ABC-2 type transport system ATP-binding protein